MSEGDARSGDAGTDLGPDDARALLRAWLDSVGLDLDGRELLALHAGRRLHPRRPLPPRAPRARAQARARRSSDVAELAGDGRGDGSPLARATGARCSSACLPAIPYVPAAAFLGARRPSSPRATASRGASRSSPTRRRHARRDAHDRRDPRARRPGLRGRGDRHRPRTSTAGCPRSPRSTSRSTRACRSACRACRRSSRRSPRAATTWSTSARPGPPASRPRSSRGSWSCRCSAATTPSSPPTPALRSGDRALEAAWPTALGAFYGQCEPRALAERGDRRVAARARHRPDADRPLGPRRRHRALRPRAARPGTPAPARSRSSTPGA